MMTWGVDLSVNLADTGVCALTWERERVVAAFPEARTDDDLVDIVAARGDVVGLDVPLGWPVEFAAAVGRYMAAPDAPWTEDPGPFTASYPRLRATDRFATELGRRRGVRIRPMSVAADKLAAPAMKAAWILTAAARRGAVLDRTGITGRALEAYPAAAVQVWDLRLPAYRNQPVAAQADAVAACCEQVAARAGFPITGLEAARTDHQLDALLCALVARAARLGMTVPPPAGLQQVAALEGWIHVPVEDSLPRLLRGP
jgi:predicted nuclease with RNAse H fold